jgi:quercetin dioxygenase-like cupin family protein
VLLKTDLAGAEGKEAVMVFAEIAPGATTGKHLHAGQEFAYILEGALLLTVDGKPAVTFKPGDAFQQPPQQVHEGQNASTTAPVKILAFYIADKGQPLTTVLSQISIFEAKFENRVSEIQWRTELKIPEKANLRQNPFSLKGRYGNDSRDGIVKLIGERYNPFHCVGI